MSIDFGPRRLDRPLLLETAGIMAQIGAKYKDGPILGDGLIDAEVYAFSQMEYYSGLSDEDELLEWSSAYLQKISSKGQRTDKLREKLIREGKDYIEGAEGDAGSIRHGEALLNLARSF